MSAIADRIHHSPSHFEIQRVGWSRPFAWLRQGASDLRGSLGVSVTHGVGMTLFGWLMFAAFGTDPYFVAAAVTAFLLVAPVMSTGLCEIARRSELGQSSTFDDSIAPLARDGRALLKYGALLGVGAVGWFAVSEVLLRPLFPGSAPGFSQALYRSFLEQVNPAECLAYVISGGGLGLAVFAVSVVTIPLVIDRHAGASQAMRASLETVRRNPAAMITWAVLLTVLTLVGFATMLLGMTLIIPLLGHATWRAYRDLVQR